MLSKATVFAKIDLRDAFYSMLLPRGLRHVSTFPFDNSYYVFNRLPMGLFISAFILQTVLRTVLAQVPWVWIHLDNILLWETCHMRLARKVATCLRLLNEVGFKINPGKSSLAPTSDSFLRFPLLWEALGHYQGQESKIYRST